MNSSFIPAGALVLLLPGVLKFRSDVLGVAHFQTSGRVGPFNLEKIVLRF